MPDTTTSIPGSRAVTHFRASALFLGLAFAISLAGCRNKKEEARQRAEMTTALQQFTAQVTELQRQSAGLRARFDKLPEDLPGLAAVHDDLHTLEEVVGVEDGRTKWLGSQMEQAFAAGKEMKKAQLEALRDAIPRSTAAIDQMAMKVMHELLPLEGLASQRRFFQEVDAANAKRRAGTP